MSYKQVSFKYIVNNKNFNKKIVISIVQNIFFLVLV